MNGWDLTSSKVGTRQKDSSFRFLLPRAGDKIEAVYARLLPQQRAGPAAFPLVIGGEGRNGAQGTFTVLCSAGFGMLGWLEFAHIPDLSGKRRLSCTQLQSYALCTPKQIRGFVFSLDFSLAAGKKNISKDSKRKLQAGNSVSPKCSKQGKLDLGKDAKWEQMW